MAQINILPIWNREYSATIVHKFRLKVLKRELRIIVTFYMVSLVTLNFGLKVNSCTTTVLKAQYIIYPAFFCLCNNCKAPKVAPLHLVGGTQFVFS